MDVRRFPRRQDASSENPAGSADPVQSTGRAGRGVLSLRQVSLHKQRKVARAVTARKLLILMSAKERRVRTRPTRLWRNGRRVKTRPTGLRLLLEQEQLAALAPSSGASRHLLPQAGEGLFGCSPASGRRAVWLLSRKREKGCLAELPQAGEGLFDRAPAGGRRAAPPLWKRLWPTVALPWRREPEVKARGCSRSHEGLGGYPNIARIDASSGCSTMPFSVTMASTSAAGVTSNTGFHARMPSATMRLPATPSSSDGSRSSISIRSPDAVSMSTVDDGATTMNFRPW